MTLGQKLKYLREKAGLTQEELGKMMGYNFRVISKWEKDIAIPNAKVMYQLSTILGESMENILNDNFTFEPQEKEEEYVDVLQEDGRKTGFVASKDRVHERGLWHREVSVWIANRKGQYLLTKRAKEKEFDPDKWAIVAGHVLAGEDDITAIERILKRELNLSKQHYTYKTLITHRQKVDGIKFKFFTVANKVSNHAKKVNKRFASSYILFLDVPIEEVRYNKQEFSEIKFFTLEEIKELIKTGTTVFNKEYDLAMLAEGLNIDLLDVVDENNQPTGRVEEKSEVHQKGLWHRESLCFICNHHDEILTYKRVMTTKVNPGVVVPFFGGHVVSGESYEEGVIRELKEEVGISPINLQFLRTNKQEDISKVTNRSFTSYYVCQCDKKIEEFGFSPFEIDQPKWMKYDDLLVFLQGEPVYQKRFKEYDLDGLLQQVKTYMDKMNENKR